MDLLLESLVVLKHRAEEAFIEPTAAIEIEWIERGIVQEDALAAVTRTMQL